MHAVALTIATLICLGAGWSGGQREVASTRPPIAVEAPESDDVSVAALDLAMHGSAQHA